MLSLTNSFLKIFENSLIKCRKSHPTFTVCRYLHKNKDFYRSSYQKNYLDPVKTKEELEKPLAEDDPLRFYPIRAPENDGTPSIFRDELIDKFVNMIMIGGQKELARKIMRRACTEIKHRQMNLYLNTEDPEERAKIELDPLKIIKQAVINASPVLRLIPYLRGGVIYQVPSPVTPEYSRFMAMKWFVRMNRDRKVKGHMHHLLADEFLGAYKKEGRIMQAKYDLHKICEANRAYAHFRMKH